MKNGLIISRDLADWNGLEIGDTLTGIYYSESNTPAVDMEIVGIFDIVADKDDAVNLYDNASYFDYSNYTFCSMEAAEGLLEGWGDENEGISEAYFYVSDAAQLDSVIEEVQKISSINWNNFNITTNDEVYQNISSALSDTETLITTLIVVITAVSMVLITLILSMSIRSRKRETGILLAVGIAKPAVILQYVLETLLIAAVAFPLAYLSSKQVAGAWVRCSARRRRMSSSHRSISCWWLSWAASCWWRRCCAACSGTPGYRQCWTGCAPVWWP